MGTGEMLGQPDKMLVVTCDGLTSHPGGVAILLVTSCKRNREIYRLCLGPNPDFIVLLDINNTKIVDPS